MLAHKPPANKRDRAGSSTGHDVDACPYCGSPDLFTVACEHGPHHRRLGCSACGRFVRWLPAPMTLERALGLPMPFGKHKGEPLGAIAESDVEYLDWPRSIDLRPTPRKAVDLVLAYHHAGEADG